MARPLLRIVAEELTAHFNCEAADRARRGQRNTPPADRRQHAGHGRPDRSRRGDPVPQPVNSLHLRPPGRDGPGPGTRRIRPQRRPAGRQRIHPSGAGRWRGRAVGGAAQKADGAYLPIEVVGKPLRDDSGRIVGAILALRDITERRTRRGGPPAGARPTSDRSSRTPRT